MNFLFQKVDIIYILIAAEWRKNKLICKMLYLLRNESFWNEIYNSFRLNFSYKKKNENYEADKRRRLELEWGPCEMGTVNCLWTLPLSLWSGQSHQQEQQLHRARL